MPDTMAGAACAFCVCRLKVAKVAVASNTISITGSVFLNCIFYPSLYLSLGCLYSKDSF
jgi:hypothetical protein